MSRIFVALSTFAKEDATPLKRLEASGIDFNVNTTGKRLEAPQLMQMASKAQGIVAGLEPYDAAVLANLPALKCISRCGVGIDNVDLKEAKARGIAVLNTPEVVITPVAELAVGMIFDLMRGITAHTALLRQGKWERLTGRNLYGKTAGIIGLGRIGRRVATMLTALGLKVIAFDLFPDKAWSAANGITLLDLETLLSQSDIVTIHAAYDSQRPLLLDKAKIALMKQGAFLVNVSRGNLVDEAALHEALVQGHLAGAGLDVFAKEPYAGPLAAMPNVVLTPHVGTLTAESRGAMELEAVDNLIRFFKEGM